MEYFPTVQERLSMNIRFTPNIAAMTRGHGKTRACLHRFKLLHNATCICKQEDQTVDHLLYHCKLLDKQRGTLKKKRYPPRTMANKQTGVNHEVSETIRNLYRINRF